MKDYLLLLDENEKLKRIVNAYEFYDDEIKSTTAGERVLTFKMNDSVVDIENGNKIGVFVEGKFDLFIVDQVEAETYYSTSIKVTCLHDFYSIQTQKAITQYYKESISVHDAMTEMLKGTSYELGECVERALIPIGPYLYKNPLWCIQDIISNFGVEIDYSIELNETRTGISKKLVHVVNALGSDTGIRCSTDLNVNKIKRVQKDKFYTVMYGCGAEYQKDLVKYKYDFKDISWSTSNGNPTDKPAGQEFVEDKKAIAKYGRIIGIFEDGRIKDPELLLKKTWEALQKNNRPIISYELDIEELKNEEGYEHLNFKLGDIIILQNTIDNSRAKFRIVEDCKSIRNKNKRKVTVGEQLKGIFSGGNSGNNDGTEGPGGSVIDPGGEEIQPPSLEEITPDTLPAVPVVTAKGLWAKVMLSWTYESKMYYNYEVYASRIKDFEPTVFHMVYSGKASAFLHEAGANETWYYRVRAVNTFGSATEFSEQVEATTTKVSDGTEFFESAAIKDALIEELRLDRGWIGTLRGHYIDARELSVTDGNGKRTLDIDSFGKVVLQPSSMKVLIDDKVEFLGTGEERNMALYGGQMCAFDSTNSKFLSTAGAIIATNYGIRGSGFLMSKHCNHFLIGRDAEWDDIYTNRAPKPTYYFDIDFENYQIKLGLPLLTGDVNLRGSSLYDAQVGYIKDWYGFGWRLHSDGHQLMYAEGHRVKFNVPVSFDGNQLMNPTLYTDRFYFTNGHLAFQQSPGTANVVSNGSHWDWNGMDIVNANLRQCQIVYSLDNTSPQTTVGADKASVETQMLQEDFTEYNEENNELIVHLGGAVKEIYIKNKQLEEDNEYLKSENAKLKNVIDTLLMMKGVL